MAETLVILNPNSGDGAHTDTVRQWAELEGYALEETKSAGDSITIARNTAESGVTSLIAAGGDGTVNEVVRGIDQADAFDSVELGILPLGTGNNFARQLGITGVDDAFEIIEHGDRRHIDLGQAGDRPFVNSCVAGLTADASSQTSAELKDQLGVLAYVITTLRSVSDFESLKLTVDITAGDDGTSAWTGEALSVLVGNGRRFTPGQGTQADMEDGRFDVTVIEDVSALNLMGEAVMERLFGRDSTNVVRTQTPALSIRVHHPEAVRFSLDGEIIKHRSLSLKTRPATLTVAVGDPYDPEPGER